MSEGYQATQHTFQGCEGRPLNFLVYHPTPDSPDTGVVVPLVHGLAGDMWGNGNTYVDHLVRNLPAKGVAVALLQRGGEGVAGYTGGLPGGSSRQTLAQEVHDTAAGLEAVSKLGYERIVPLGFSLGFLLVAAAAQPELRNALGEARIDHVLGLSPTRLHTWMGMTDPERHQQTLSLAESAVADGNRHQIVITDHAPYGLLWEADAYRTMSSDKADPVVHAKGLHQQGVGLSIAYGTDDENMVGSYGGFRALEQTFSQAHPGATFTPVGAAPHNMQGHERQVEQFVLSSLDLA